MAQMKTPHCTPIVMVRKGTGVAVATTLRGSGGDDDCKRAIKGVLWTPGYKCLHNLNRISVILTAGDGASFVQSVQGEFPGGRPEKSVPLRISPPPSFKADKCSYSSDKSLRIISIWIPGN